MERKKWESQDVRMIDQLSYISKVVQPQLGKRKRREVFRVGIKKSFGHHQVVSWWLIILPNVTLITRKYILEVAKI